MPAHGGGTNRGVKIFGPVFLGFRPEIDPGTPLDRRSSPGTSICTKNQPRGPILRPFRGVFGGSGSWAGGKGVLLRRAHIPSLGVALTGVARLRGKILDFPGLGGPRRPGNPSKMWGVSPPTFLKGFPAARGRPNPKNPGFSLSIWPPTPC